MYLVGIRRLQAPPVRSSLSNSIRSLHALNPALAAPERAVLGLTVHPDAAVPGRAKQLANAGLHPVRRVRGLDRFEELEGIWWRGRCGQGKASEVGRSEGALYDAAGKE